MSWQTARLPVPLLLAGASAAIGCQHASSDVVAIWSVGPPVATVSETTRVELTLQRSDGVPVSGARLRIEGHMSHPGMTPVIAEAAEGPSGMYRARLRLTMAGDWTLVASGTLADGSRFIAQHDLRSSPQPP